jgi:predicted RND superfamily exporter protein
MMMMMGIVVSLMVTLILFGSILSILKKWPSHQTSHISWHVIHGYVIHAVQYYGGYIKYCALILVIGFGFGISLLTVENRFIDYFDSDTKIHKSLLYIDQNFGGTTPMDIVITLASRKVSDGRVSKQPATPDYSTQGDDFDFDLNETDSSPQNGVNAINANGLFGMMLTPQKVDLVKKAHQYLEKQPEIGKVLSLATTFDLIETLYQRPLNVFELMVLPRVIPEEYKSILWSSYLGDTKTDPNFDLGLQFRLTTRVYDSNPTLRRNEMIERIQNELPDVLNINSDQILITGPMVLYNKMLQALFDSQIKSLGIVLIFILSMLSILFRNIRLAFVAVIPNLFSVIVVLGVMGWLKIPLDMMTTTIAAITIGIAIDNAIHYIYRFKREYFQFTGTEDETYIHALTATQNAIGTAMIYTTIVVSLGFGVLAFSEFIPNVLFGLLTALAMIISLFSSLILVPIFLKLLNPFRKKKFLFR